MYTVAPKRGAGDERCTSRLLGLPTNIGLAIASPTKPLRDRLISV
ncbi:MAG TPA: hypothetical protein V6D14_06260 [Coleofasciculaceae cyanobacterium]